MLLEGKIALITGSSRGIGWAAARVCAAQGAKVFLNGVSDEALLRERAESLRAEFGGFAEALLFDASDPSQVKDAYGAVFRQFKRLDVLVNNAGILQDNLLAMVSPEEMHRTFRANVESVILNMQYASRLMARNRAGSIVNISSIIGRVGNEGNVVYGASKAAVIGATYSAAKELAAQNIRVNAVAPGFIETDMVRGLSTEKYEQRIASIRMGRAGAPEDVANMVLFLASDLSSYVTGQVIGVDGGMLI